MAGRSFLFVVGSSRCVADPLVKVLELSAGYLGATFKGALLGTGSWPGDVLNDAGAVQRARSFFD
jgi:hypothetical protein